MEAEKELKNIASLIESILDVNDDTLYTVYDEIMENKSKLPFLENVFSHAICIRPKKVFNILKLVLMFINEDKECIKNKTKEDLIRTLSNNYCLKGFGFSYCHGYTCNHKLEDIIASDDVIEYIKVESSPGFDPNKPIMSNLDIGLYIYSTHEEEYTVIQLMALYGAVKCFKYALLNNYYNFSGVNQFAIAGGNVEIIHLLEQKGVSFDGCFQNSVKYHRYKISNWLLDNYSQNYKISEVSKYYNFYFYLSIPKNTIKDNTDTYNDLISTLFIAVSDNNFALLRYLIDSFDIDVEKPYKMYQNRQASIATQLMLDALIKEHDEIVKYLVDECNADLSITFPETANIRLDIVVFKSTLHKAVENDSLEMVKYIYEHNKNLIDSCMLPDKSSYNYNHLKGTKEFTDIINATPMCIAVNRRYLEIVKYFVETCHADILSKYLDSEHEISDYLQSKIIQHVAAVTGNFELIKFLHKQNMLDPNIYYKGRTVLHDAIDFGHFEIAKYLIEECKADPHAITYFGEKTHLDHYNSSTLIIAACSENVEMVKYLIDKCHVRVDIKDYMGNTALLHACCYGNLEMVKAIVKVYQDDPSIPFNEDVPFLVTSTIDPDAFDVGTYLIDTFYPVIKEQGLEKILDALVGFEDVLLIKYIIDKYNVVPTHALEGENFIYSIREKKEIFDFVKYLIDEKHCGFRENVFLCGLKKEHSDYFSHLADLHEACSENDLTKVKKLIEEEKMYPDLFYNDRTPFMICALNGNVEIARYLFEKCKVNPEAVSENPDFSDACRETPMSLAIENNHIQFVKFLVEECHVKVDEALQLTFKAKNKTELFNYLFGDLHLDVNVKNAEGYTNLMNAVSNDDLSLVKMLYETFHADVNVEFKVAEINCYRAINLALENKNIEMVKYLVDVCHANLGNFLEKGKEVTLLVKAVSVGNLEIVKYLIEECHLDPNERINGDSAIESAIKTNNLAIVKYLVLNQNVETKFINKKVPTKILQKISAPLIHFLVDKCRWCIYKEYLHNCGSVANNYLKYKTSLHRACLESAGQIISQSLSDPNIDVECLYNGMTALAIAASMNRKDVVISLVNDHKANIEARDIFEMTPMQIAFKNGNAKLGKFFIEDLKANINAKCASGRTVIHIAAENNDLETIEYLVNKCHIDINLADDNGVTPLHIILQKSNANSVEIMIKKLHANVNAKDGSGRTAAHFAAMNIDKNVLKFLVDKFKVDIEAKDNEGRTPLHAAVIENNISTVKYLVEECGSNIEEKDNEGKAPLHYCAEHNFICLIKCLTKSYHADVESADNNGNTPVYYCVKSHNIRAANYLIKECSASVNDKLMIEYNKISSKHVK